MATSEGVKVTILDAYLNEIFTKFNIVKINDRADSRVTCEGEELSQTNLLNKILDPKFIVDSYDNFNEILNFRKEKKQEFDKYIRSQFKNLINPQTALVAINKEIETQSIEWLLSLDKFVDSKTGELVLWDSEDNELADITPKAFEKLIGRKYIENLKAQHLIRPIYTEYNPYDIRPMFTKVVKGKDLAVINKYSAPPWRHVKPNGGMPPEIEKLFNNWFPVDWEREYIFDWLKDALLHRCSHYLYLLGVKGLGKGVFCDMIVTNLVGQDNCTAAPKSFFESPFQSILENNRIIVFDECTVKSTKEKNVLKRIINHRQIVEKKHHDPSKMQDIFYSGIITSNNMGDILVEHDDRRIFLPETKKEKLNKTLSKKETGLLKGKLENDIQFLSNLGHAIINRPDNPDFDSENAPITKTFKKVADFCLSEWKQNLVDILTEWDFTEDEIPVKDLRDQIVDLIPSNGVRPKGPTIVEFLRDFEVNEKPIVKIVVKGTKTFVGRIK